MRTFPLDRRILGVLVAVAAVGAPAVVLRAMCVGRSCQQPVLPDAPAPFCSLPGEIRAGITSGFREGRSPDLLAVTGASEVLGGAGFNGPDTPAWPALAPTDAARVPLIFWGAGIDPEADVPPGTGLQSVAPTVAELIGFRRPHPEVRSGLPVPGVSAGARAPRLVLQVVWKHVGSRYLEDTRFGWGGPVFLETLLREGAGTMDAAISSLPLDPAAVLTTLGTGGLPSEHGITGTLVRDGDRVVRAWSPNAPFSVIATLGDDLDQGLRQRPRIGLVGTTTADRGAIGGNWYLQGDRDDLAVVSGGPGEQAAAAVRLLRSGYGTDDVPDLLVVVMEGPVTPLDRALRRVVAEAKRVSGGSVAVVVTATGSTPEPNQGALTAAELRREVEQAVGEPVIESLAVGGLFLDQAALAESGMAQDAILRALRALRGPGGDRLLADAFPGIAVSLSRYC